MTEREQELFDYPNQYGSEYSLDVVSYQKPPEWEYELLSHDIAVDASAGSIDAVRFMNENRIKLHPRLGEHFQFRLTHFDERNNDRIGNVHTFFELAFFPWSGVGVAAYGSPSYHKRENDDGAALLFRPVPSHELRVFYTYVDVTRQKRNDRNDSFDHQPFTTGIVGRWFGERNGSSKKMGNFLEYSYRYEDRLGWNFPDEKYRYEYSKQAASLYWSQGLGESTRLHWRAQVDRKFEEKTKTDSTSLITPDDWTTDRLLLLISVPFSELGPTQRWELAPGFSFQHRRWSTRRDTLKYFDYVPNLTWKIPGFGSGDKEGFWSFQAMATYHRKSGGISIGHPGEKDPAIDGRFNVGYTFAYTAKFEFVVNAGFDIDGFGTKETWEGGLAQLRYSY